MKLFTFLSSISPKWYTALVLIVLSALWTRTLVSTLEAPQPISEWVVEESKYNDSFGSMGSLNSQYFGLPILIYRAFGENVDGLMSFHLFLWMIAAGLALFILQNWRGKLTWWDMIVPFLFLNPTTVQTLHDQWMGNALLVLYVLSLVLISRGYLKPWKFATAFAIIAFGTFIPGGIAVTLVAAIFFGVHWLKTRWYTSGFLMLWLVVISALFFYVSHFSIELDALVRIGNSSIMILYHWLEMFFGRWAQAMVVEPSLSIVALAFSFLCVYGLVHPWIRPRKRPNRERDLLLILGFLLMQWVGGFFFYGWHADLGGYTTLLLFALYWSAQIQRRWPKRMPRVIFVYLILTLFGSWVELQYFLKDGAVKEVMNSLGFENFLLG